MEVNGLTGLSTNEVWSLVLTFLLFGGYVTAEAVALALFYVTSRPRVGRVRTAAVWHFIGAVWFMLAIISMVWAAPAQKSFLDDATTTSLFPLGQALKHPEWRFAKVAIGLIIAAIGLACLMAGAVLAGRQKRIWRQQALPA